MAYLRSVLPPKGGRLFSPLYADARQTVCLRFSLEAVHRKIEAGALYVPHLI